MRSYLEDKDVASALYEKYAEGEGGLTRLALLELTASSHVLH